MQPRRYTVQQGEKFTTINAMSPVGAVARISQAPRHSWQEQEGGALTVQAKNGAGVILDVYTVKETT